MCTTALGLAALPAPSCTPPSRRVASAPCPLHPSPPPPAGPCATPPRPLRPARSDLLRVISDACHAASRPGKAGLVKEALTGGYPRLALLLEGAFDKLAQVGAQQAPPLPPVGNWETEGCMWHACWHLVVVM